MRMPCVGPPSASEPQVALQTLLCYAACSADKSLLHSTILQLRLFVVLVWCVE
jgi:hypothetical protein